MTSILFLVVAAVLLMTAAFLFTPAPYVRRASRKALRAQAEVAERDPEAAERLAIAVGYELLRDVWVNRRAARHLTRYERRNIRLVAGLYEVGTLAVIAACELHELLTKRREASSETPPKLSRRAASVVNYGFLLPADMVVVSAAMMAQDATLAPLLAIIGSGAFAATLWVNGKWLATHFADKRLRLRVLVPAVATVSLAIALGLLRTQKAAVWAVLSIAPAMGSMSVSVVSQSGAYESLAFAQRRWTRLERRFRHAWRRLARRAGRAAGSRRRASLAVGAALALQPAELAAAGLRTFNIVAETPLLDAVAKVGDALKLLDVESDNVDAVVKALLDWLADARSAIGPHGGDRSDLAAEAAPVSPNGAHGPDDLVVGT